LPYAILEACIAGLPIVSTNVGGIREIIKNEKNGLLVLPRNPEALAQAIKKLINEPDLREKLGQNAKIDVKQNFGIEKMIKKTRELYLE